MSLLTNQKKFFPAMYCWDPDRGGIEHALRNIKIFVDNGADGVFLISGNLHYLAVLDIYKEVRTHFPNLWIGINFFDLVYDSNWAKLEQVLRTKTPSLNGLWLDALPPQNAFAVPETLSVFCSAFADEDTFRNTCTNIKLHDYIPVVVFREDSLLMRGLLPLEITQSIQATSTVAMYVNTIAGTRPFMGHISILILAEKGMMGFFAALGAKGVEDLFDCAKIQSAATLLHMS